MKIALASILTVIFLVAVLLNQTLRALPAKELRRRARAGKYKRATSVYKLAAFGPSAEIFVRLLGALSAAGVILLAADAAWWAGMLVILLILRLVWVNRLPSAYDGWRWHLAGLIAPVITVGTSLLQPILGRFVSWRKRLVSGPSPTGLYEKEDLLEFLKIQARQTDNRISPDELKIARGALTLSDKTVGQVMTPKRQIKWIAASESVGPMVMDELHQSGQSRFPVVKEVTKAANPEIVGALYLKDLLDQLENKGRIRDIMHPGVSYINESQNLLAAVDGFLTSGQFLLMVVNNFEEVVGVLTIEDLLKEIFGDQINTDFDRYYDARAVSGLDAQQSGGQPNEAKVE